MIMGWMQHIGPATAHELGERVGLAAAEVHKALLRMEAAGSVLRGSFTRRQTLINAPVAGAASQPALADPLQQEFCERRLLARIHRLTLGRLRKQIQPVNAATYMGWLLQWQHIKPGTELGAGRGLLEILRQMEGL